MKGATGRICARSGCRDLILAGMGLAFPPCHCRQAAGNRGSVTATACQPCSKNIQAPKYPSPAPAPAPGRCRGTGPAQPRAGNHPLQGQDSGNSGNSENSELNSTSQKNRVKQELLQFIPVYPSAECTPGSPEMANKSPVPGPGGLPGQFLWQHLPSNLFCTEEAPPWAELRPQPIPIPFSWEGRFRHFTAPWAATAEELEKQENFHCLGSCLCQETLNTIYRQ